MENIKLRTLPEAFNLVTFYTQKNQNLGFTINKKINFSCFIKTVMIISEKSPNVMVDIVKLFFFLSNAFYFTISFEIK